MNQRIFKLVLFFLCLFFSFSLCCEEVEEVLEGEPSTDVDVTTSEPSPAVEADAIIAEEESVVQATKPVAEVVSKPKPVVKKVVSLQLLDIHDAELVDARVMGIEIGKREQLIADVDSAEDQTNLDSTEAANDSKSLSESPADEKRVDGTTSTYRSWNKIAKVWVPRCVIILLFLLLIMLFRSRSRKKRRRYFS